MKPNKQPYIDFIIDCFGKGIVERGEVLAKFGKVWQTPPRTFDRYFQKAKEQHSRQRETINNAKLNTTIELEKEAVKKAILTKHQALEILTEIAQGKAKKVEGQIIMPSPNERKGAIETMMKMEGWTAPIKTENTNIELKQPFFGNMDLDE